MREELLADAEGGEDSAEKVVGGDGAEDLAEGVEGFAEVQGEEFGASAPFLYFAETGVLAHTPVGAPLIMLKGNIERSEESGARLSVLKFDRYVFDLDEYAGQPRANERETSERYLSELLEPQLTGDNQDTRRGVYLAEAHNRLSGPLYCLAFALIALAATAAERAAGGSHKVTAFRLKN